MSTIAATRHPGASVFSTRAIASNSMDKKFNGTCAVSPSLRESSIRGGKAIQAVGVG
jgi:hypothetical protein